MASMRKVGCVILGMLPLFAHAFIVKSITFEGLSRIPLSQVSADQPVKVGDDLTPQVSTQVIQDLFKTGYFKNIQLINQNGHLIIQVEELPTIAKVSIKGNELIKTSDLQPVLNSVGLQVGNMFNQTLINQIQQSLIQEYNRQGKYAARITVDVVPVSGNRVDVTIQVSEGLDTEIQTINFIGNHVFSSRELSKQLQIATPGIISFFTKDDVYTPEKLAASLQSLSDYYQNHGYVDFRILSAEASLDTTHTKAYVTLSVSEGAQYHFAGYTLTGHLVLPQAQYAKLVSLKPGEVYSKADILSAQKAMINALGDQGYAFANVNPVPKIDQAKKTVFITFYVTPGQKVYVKQLAFGGNTVTNDQTLRERMKFVEGSTYSKTKIDESKVALQRLPYIKDVQVSTVPVANSTDQVDVNYHVKEQSANTVSGAIGYSELYRFILQAGFNMNNVFGTGNIFGINAQLSKPYQNVNVSYTEPFFTRSGISQTTSLYYTHVDAGEEGLTNFSTNSYGATLGYSVPISTWNFFNFGGGIDQTTLQQPGNGYQSETVTNFIADNGSQYRTYTLNFGLSRDSTNNAYFPTQGETGSLGVNFTVPGSDLDWYKLNANGMWYHALNAYFTLSVGGGVYYGNGYGKTSQLPFFLNYYGGGWGSVRGYTQGTMGPQDTQICTNGNECPLGSTIEGAALGGNFMVDSTVQLTYPVPFMTDHHNLKLITFIDDGNVYDTYQSSTVWNAASNPTTPNFGNIRYTVGVGLEWVSPLGPVGISFATPINSPNGDSAQVFQFTLGTFF